MWSTDIKRKRYGRNAATEPIKNIGFLSFCNIKHIISGVLFATKLGSSDYREAKNKPRDFAGRLFFFFV
jgi:hypothetical protein